MSLNPNKIISLQELINAQVDAYKLELIMNEAPWVEITTRLGRKCYSIATIQGIIDQYKIKVDTELAGLQEAIDTALAAGVGAAGWTDRLVQTWSGRTQEQENRAFITTVNYLADLDTLPKFNGRKVTVLSYSSSVKSEPLLYVYDSSRASENNGGTVWNGWVAQLNGYLTPEMFGAKGTGSNTNPADDHTAIANMYAAIPTHNVAEIKPNPRKEYAMSKSLSVTARFVCNTQFRLVAIGGALSPEDTFLSLSSDTNISRIDIRVPTGSTWWRLIRTGKGQFGMITVNSANIVLGGYIASGAAVSLNSDGKTTINTIQVSGFQNAVIVRNSNDVRIDNLITENSYRGLRVSGSNYVNIGYHIHKSAPQNWDYYDGAFGQDLEDVKFFNCDYVETYDTTSHGVRVSGNSDYSSEHITWGTIKTYRSGRCGFKLQGSLNSDGDSDGTPTWIGDVSIGQLIVVDAGKISDNYLKDNGGVGEYSDNGTGIFGGANEYGCSIIKSTRVDIGYYSVRKVTNTYASCSAGLNVRSCRNVNILTNIEDAYYYGIKFGASEATIQNVNIYGKISNIGTYEDNTTTNDPITSKNTRGYGVWMWDGSVSSLRNCIFDLDIINARRGYYSRATSFPQPTLIRGTIMRCYDGVDDGSPSSNQYHNSMVVVAPRT